MTCCETCLNECCTCNTERTCSCPDFLGDWAITIDSTVEWEITISAPESNTITSSDDTVGIDETVNPDGSVEYDLSITCCDRKVWACANDPVPSTLDDKLFVTAPLTRTISNCNTDGRMTIWIDVGQIADEKVRVDGWCPDSVFLVDAIEAGVWLRAYVDNCKLVIEAEPTNFIKPMCKLMLSADSVVERTHNLVDDTEEQWFFILPMDVEADNNGSGASDWIVTDTDTIYWTQTKTIKIVKDWFYRVSFKFNCDINYWIHALRWCVFSSMANKFLVLDDKDQWESQWYAISQNATVDAKTDITYAKQLSFHSSDVAFFEADTEFSIWGRIDPNVTVGNGAWEDAWMIVRRAWLVLWWLWGVWSTSENDEAWCTLTVEWVSDADGWILYK